MAAFQNNAWFNLDDKNLLDACWDRIQKKEPFEIHVSSQKAVSVERAVMAFISVDQADTLSFPQKLLRLCDIYRKSFRFPSLMGVINSAQLARFEIYLRKEQDRLCIAFKPIRTQL